jgi:hypothetical protein
MKKKLIIVVADNVPYYKFESVFRYNNDMIANTILHTYEVFGIEVDNIAVEFNAIDALRRIDETKNDVETVIYSFTVEYKNEEKLTPEINKDLDKQLDSLLNHLLHTGMENSEVKYIHRAILNPDCSNSKDID